ncbi:hypothetical protein [Paraburkholderia fungorum]|jgi:hypothetical protein|uniref:Uncharacterized protein n=1 Tax=Paraburkholderia fungorum TaxID=134537 RepID=A0AAW3V4G8_9BURK|nr:hypothetical protein [Paraburkholderia fungorum]AJZ56343.1 hypothetical protein OI25_7995 [Paraburkholderia fungorum]MBB4519909.1 hypothetical protein [Paraburkholderia fungorum]MBB5546786.1 hypothetical protein [Paraburkholderia fungorum]MBB6205226.1 hypothetical protein [Paraburkholderia fungorum]MBU7442973.1 hypothetical protein [Paraburkholderia fungorum]
MVLSDDCRQHLYRVVWETREGFSVIAYTLAFTREGASKLFHELLAPIAREPADELALYNIDSYRDLTDKGVSEDEDMRVFETGWKGNAVVNWAERPLFLTADPTLVSKWAELQAELAAQRAREAIDRAGGPR